MNFVADFVISKTSELVASKIVEKKVQKQEEARKKLEKIISNLKEKIKSKGKKKKKVRTAVPSYSCVIHGDDIFSHVHYLNPGMLMLFMNSKGFINKGKYNSICVKHQRWLRKQIVIARHLHLLPYIVI